MATANFKLSKFIVHSFIYCHLIFNNIKQIYVIKSLILYRVDTEVPYIPTQILMVDREPKKMEIRVSAFRLK